MKLGLNTAERKKEKKHILPCFFSFFFSFTLWKNHHGDVVGEHAQAQPSGVRTCLGRFLFASKSILHAVQLDPVTGWP